MAGRPASIKATQICCPPPNAMPHHFTFVLIATDFEPKDATGGTADNKGWVLTGRIDFVDPHSNGEFVLQVEETQIANSPSGVEHREIRWRRAALDEAKMVLVSYHTQRKLLMSANFIVSAPRETSKSANSQGEKGELKYIADGQGLADVKPVTAEATGDAPTDVS